MWPAVRTALSLFLLSLLATSLHAQSTSQRRDATVWYFGIKAGMTFAAGAPAVLTNGKLETLEGSAVACDPVTGAMRFYTDGVTVWDATHTVMPNGTELKGHWTSAQSALIVPLPGDSSIYYIFTSGAGLYHNPNQNNHGPPNNGVRYSIVDMKMNGGRGDVVTKNVELLGQATEMLSATHHCNGVDYWVIAHDWGVQNGFRSYLMTSQGIVDTVVTRIGADYTDGFRTQCMVKLSSNGKLMAVTCPTKQIFELFDFDNSTGIVSNHRPIGSGFNYYSAAFSPDNTKLYTGSLADNSDPNHIYQFDLSNPTLQAVQNSRYEVRTQGGQWQGAQLQLAPDGRIYASWFGRDRLSVINRPNLSGAACNYVHDGFLLGTGRTQYGLPNFIESDVYGTSISSIDAQLHLESSISQIQVGQTVQVNLITCNNSTVPLTNVALNVALPAGLTYVSGLGSYPNHTIASLPPGTCDTVTLQATVDAGLQAGQRLTTCATLSTPGSGPCLSAQDSTCFELQVVAPIITGPVDYTFYAVASCPGTHDTVHVRFNSDRYTDTITRIEFGGAHGSWMEYAGPRPVNIVITPTTDQYIPVYVRWPGVTGRISSVMSLLTSNGDTFRIGIESSIPMLTTPTLSVGTVHVGTHSGVFDTCVTVRNITPRQIRFTDSTWLRGGGGSVTMVSPGFPLLLAPGATATICLRASAPTSGMSDTLLLGGMEVWECPHCALALIVVDGQPRSAIADVDIAGTGDASVLTAQIAPNPVHGRGSLMLKLHEPLDLRITLVAPDGTIRMVLAGHRYERGEHVIQLDASVLAAGNYLVRIEGSGITVVRQMVVIH